jgi:hypothetical protein
VEATKDIALSIKKAREAYEGYILSTRVGFYDFKLAKNTPASPFTRDSFERDMKTIALALFLPMVIRLAFWIVGLKAPSTLSCLVLLISLYTVLTHGGFILLIPGVKLRIMKFVG